jgi:cytidylate kinase
METQSGFEKCLPFIASQFHPDGEPQPASGTNVPRLAVTISRQSGSGGHAVGEKLAEYLQAQAPKSSLPWMVFDRNLVEKVLEDHNLPSRLVQFMPEDRVTDLTDVIQEMFGLHPPFWTLVHLTAETILHLAEQGNVILIGRGANLVTSKLPHVFHVRLVGSLEKRVEHMQKIRGLGKKAARELVRDEDRGRQRYLKKYFNKEFDDPLLHHLVINTDLVSYEDAARIIGDAALHNLHQRMAPASEHSAPRRMDTLTAVSGRA